MVSAFNRPIRAVEAALVVSLRHFPEAETTLIGDDRRTTWILYEGNTTFASELEPENDRLRRPVAGLKRRLILMQTTRETAEPSAPPE
jgi:hypothetical protein